MKLAERVFETFDPWIQQVENPLMRDGARIVLPIFYGIFWLLVIGLPFTLAGQIVNGLVKVATACQ